MLSDGYRYIGQWNSETGERQGKGVQIGPNGTIYEGLWEKDRPHIRGRQITKIAAIESDIVHGKAEGKGT